MKQNTTQAASQGADGSGLDSAQVPTVDVDVDGRRGGKEKFLLHSSSGHLK